jgi:hypothetical protein
MLFCSAFFGKIVCCRSGQSTPSTEGTQHHAGNELAHDRRLANPLHGLAQQPADDEQKTDLRKEDCLRGTRWRALRCERIRRCQ